MNEKFSHKDFINQILTDTDPVEWNDTEVINSCFYNETPNTRVFPDGITGVVFVGCNLDNVIVPKECTMKDCTNKLIQVQKDGNDWILNPDLTPLEPLNKFMYTKLGISTDPASLPSVGTAEKPITETTKEQLEANLQAQIKALEATAYWR